MQPWEWIPRSLSLIHILTVKVSEVVNAGVVAYVEGIRGFIPASQLSLQYVEDLAPFQGRQLNVRVITVDPEKQKLVLSAKEILREQEKEAHDHKVAMIVPGTILNGTVESLQPYGAVSYTHLSWKEQEVFVKSGFHLKTEEKVEVSEYAILTSLNMKLHI